MAGKIVAITGCTSGTGQIAARTIAKKGGEIIMLNRPSERADKALKQLMEEVPGVKACLIPCDNGDLASVKEAAKQIREKYPDGIDVLCNNAGVMAMQDIATKDGFDVQSQTNHLAHYLLTKELFPLLEKRAEAVGEARVINHSSSARDTPGTPLTRKYFEKNGGNLGGDGERWERYHQTKLANMVFTFAMHDRCAKKGSKVKALVAHPGLASTNLQVTTNKDGGMPSLGAKILMMLSQSAEDGTCGILQCIAGPNVQSGEFYGVNGIFYGPAVLVKPSKRCTSEEAKDMLWEVSDAAIGEPFVI
eukprot:3867660-Rhodomonas_salina.1